MQLMRGLQLNLKDIREECWDIARDTATTDSDRLWTTREMNRYINRVYRFIARETKCIRDDITAAICRINVAPPTDLADLTTKAATDPYYAQDLAFYNDPDSWLYQQLVSPYNFPLDPRILDIDEVKWTKRQWRLTHTSVSKWQINPWWEQVIGMSTEYATDLSNNRFTVNFRNVESDTLKLVVRRLPLVDLINDLDEPEFRTHYHDFIVNGVLYYMYSKQDADTIDKTKASEYYGLYLKDIDEIKQQEVIVNNRLRPNHSTDAFR